MIKSEKMEIVKGQLENMVLKEDAFARIDFTVSESKHLIAHGISELPIVKGDFRNV